MVRRSLRPILDSLLKQKLIDAAIEYPFKDFGNRQKMAWYVIEKKNLGVEDLKRNGCTHCMIMDCDEFYFADEFAQAKQFIETNGITHSACSIYDYRHLPELRCRDCMRYSVPFIFELRADSQLTPLHNMPCYVDPLRSFRFDRARDNFYYFNSLRMHHMTGIRFNFEKKLRASVSNASAQGRAVVSKAKTTYDAETSLSKEELLKIKNDFGGYIDVGDPFNLNASLKLLKAQLDRL